MPDTGPEDRLLAAHIAELLLRLSVGVQSFQRSDIEKLLDVAEAAQRQIAELTAERDQFCQISETAQQAFNLTMTRAEQAEAQLAQVTQARDFQRQRADRGWALYEKTLTTLIDLRKVDMVDLREAKEAAEAQAVAIHVALLALPRYALLSNPTPGSAWVSWARIEALLTAPPPT